MYDGGASVTRTTRVFTNGNSQAVRIPRQFRLNTSRVRITLNADGDIVLHPLPDHADDVEANLLDILNRFDDEDIVAFEAAHRDQDRVQERDSL